MLHTHSFIRSFVYHQCSAISATGKGKKKETGKVVSVRAMKAYVEV
jgi:hypothetical protein